MRAGRAPIVPRAPHPTRSKRHEIRLVVDVYVSVLLPGFSTVTKVTNRCAVAETVIVGSVPDTYTYFDTREDMSSTAEDFIMNNAG